MTHPPCNSVKQCPKCTAPTDAASRQFIIGGEYGYLMRTCKACRASWYEATADTPPYERDAEDEVEALLSNGAA